MNNSATTIELTLEDERKLRLTYTLTGSREEGYGVRVSAGDYEDEARDLTRDRAEAMEFLGLVTRCAVTPASIRDVAYDWLCAKYTTEVRRA